MFQGGRVTTAGMVPGAGKETEVTEARRAHLAWTRLVPRGLMVSRCPAAAGEKHSTLSKKKTRTFNNLGNSKYSVANGGKR